VHSFPAAERFPISFDRWFGGISRLLGLPPSMAYVEVGTREIEVKMGWAFRSRFPRAAIKSISWPARKPFSRGVHGFGGRWLVNGSGRGVVTLNLNPAQRAYVVGVPTSLRELSVSVADAATLGAALIEAPGRRERLTS
jgi:hypothetical protein